MSQLYVGAANRQCVRLRLGAGSLTRRVPRWPLGRLADHVDEQLAERLGRAVAGFGQQALEPAGRHLRDR